MPSPECTRYVIDQSGLPDFFPTHKHQPLFWESLGRAVATFGFLEEVLCKAIFSFTATKPYQDEELQQAFIEWLPKLERALMDPLGRLINSYEKAVRDNPNSTLENLDGLLSDLREASNLRDVLCHGSWKIPDPNGASTPFFVNFKKEIFDTAIDTAFLIAVQKHTVNLACAVINSVTHMGWQFPGSSGPGQIIWPQ